MQSCVWLFSTPWTVAYQAPLSIGFPKQEDWNGLLLPFLGYLTNLGIKPLFPTLPMSLALQANSLPLSHQGSLYIHTYIHTCILLCVCVCVLVTQSWLAICDPMDRSLPGSSVHEILQARILEWVTIPFSRGSSWPRDKTWFSSNEDRFFIIWATWKTHMCVCVCVCIYIYIYIYKYIHRHTERQIDR